MYADRWHGRQLLICTPIVSTNDNFWFVRRSLVWTIISGLYADFWFVRRSLAWTMIFGLYADRWHGQQFLACTRISGLYADFWIVRRSGFWLRLAQQRSQPQKFRQILIWTGLPSTSKLIKKPAFHLLLTSGKQYGVPPMA